MHRRALALFLAILLGIPHPALALRAQQRENPAQTAGLEAQLTSSQAGAEEKSSWSSFKQILAMTAVIVGVSFLGLSLYYSEKAPPAQDPLVRNVAPLDPAQKEKALELSAKFLKALNEYAKRITEEGGDPEMFLGMIPHTGLPPIDPEIALDESPKQIKIVQSSPFLKFGPGILYHGRVGLDQAIRDGEVRGTTYFTRVGHQWAVRGFGEGDKDSAIFLMRTETFNGYLERGESNMGIVLDRQGTAEPNPQTHIPTPLSSYFEIWVGTDTLQRYRDIVDGKIKDPEGPPQEKLKGLLDQGKIRAIPGLKAGGKETDAHRLVGMEILRRNLLQEIPAFRARPLKKGTILTKDLKVTPGIFEIEEIPYIAAHGHLLVPLERNFKTVKKIQWHELPRDKEKAAEMLKALPFEERGIIILDEMLLNEADVEKILPKRHPPVFVVDAVTAQLLTPAAVSTLNGLRLPLNQIYLLRLRQNDLNETRLNLYA